LTDTKVLAIFNDFSLKKANHTLDMLLEVNFVEHLPDLVVLRFVERIQVLSNGTGEQHRILRDDTEL